MKNTPAKASVRQNSLLDNSSLWQGVPELAQSKISGGAKSVFERYKPHVDFAPSSAGGLIILI